MKKTVFLILFIGIISFGKAQSGFTPANETQQKEIMQKVSEVSIHLKTLRCDFVQKKTISILAEEMISEGKMYFKQKDKLRWEYTKPFQYEFVMNGDKLMTIAGNTKNIIDVNSNNAFREICKIIISGINGSGILDASRFSAKFFVGNKENMVAIVPKQKELKQMFNKINIYFNKTNYAVSSVEIIELNGDKTFIEMKNQQINVDLSDEIFSIK
jgi:outer membrane lipoprotein-sorting protein